MKNLPTIAIILFGMNGMAQTESNDSLFCIDTTGNLFFGSYVFEQIKVEDSVNFYYKGKDLGRYHYSTPDYIVLMSAYAEECYNDSTLTTIYIDPNIANYIANGVGSSTALCGYDEEVWVRKEPTFAGFIEWIKQLGK